MSDYDAWWLLQSPPFSVAISDVRILDWLKEGGFNLFNTFKDFILSMATPGGDPPQLFAADVDAHH